jgi:succinoglycan biosynthesis protein ExoM
VSAAQSPDQPQRVRIAVLTYQRPKDLAEALPRLVEQAARVANEGMIADIVVVDNDPAGGAQRLVKSFGSAGPATAASDRGSTLAPPIIDVRYEHEATPGIAAARNRALTTAGDVDLLVFIDDDERPCDHWLALLLQTYAEHHSAAVVGPVISQFAVEPDPWITAGGFFDRLRRPTGSRVDVAATNNLLLDLHQVRGLGLRFDTEFGLTGGSDTLFTRQLHRSGGRIIWCDEAIVADIVPAARVSRSWVVRRALRSGNSWSRTSLALTAGPVRRMLVRLRLSGRGLVRLAGGFARLSAGALTLSQGRRARGIRTLARGSGMLTGAWGYRYQEYKRAPTRVTT